MYPPSLQGATLGPASPNPPPFSIPPTRNSKWEDRHPFSDKVAMTREHKYDGVHGGTTWRKSTRNYVVSRAYEMDVLLKLSEAREDDPATVRSLYKTANGWITPVRLQFLSMELWGCFNLNITGEARQIFENVEDLQGFEAWRKLLKGIRSKAEVRNYLGND